MFVPIPRLLFISLTAGLLSLAVPGASAQLLQPVRATAAQPVLGGFTASGATLTRGPVTVTLDSAGGQTIGMLIEAPAANAEDVARALVAAWGAPETAVAGLTTTLKNAEFQTQARSGFVDTTDEAERDVIAVKLDGTGEAARWRIYTALNIRPASAFPATRNALGNAKAPAVIHIFSDFQCPYCKQLWDTAMVGWKANPAEYRVVHYQFPLSFHKNAFAAAEASECAGIQGKFGPYADVLFDKFDDWTKVSPAAAATLFASYASTAKLNAATFKTCLTTRATKASVDAQYQAGLKVAVQGTPTVYLNGIKVTNYTDQNELKAIRAVTAATPGAASIIAERLKLFK